MRTTLESLTDEEKLLHAIDCVANGVPVPSTIQDFLISQGLLELVMKPRKKHDPRKKNNPTRNS